MMKAFVAHLRSQKNIPAAFYQQVGAFEFA